MTQRWSIVLLGAALSACAFDPSGANWIDRDDASLAQEDADLADAPAPADAGDDPDASATIDADRADVAVDADRPDSDLGPIGCGDGVVEPPEQCDDHGTSAGDGCSPACRWEPGTCYANAQLVALTPGALQGGSTTGQTSGLSGGTTCGGSTAGDDIYTFELVEPADVTVTTALAGTDYNAVIYVRTDCNDVATQVGCASQAPLGDTLSLPELEPGSYFAIVDGFAGASGTYQIRLNVRAIRGIGEACDPFGQASRCEEGLFCQAMGTAGDAFCVGLGRGGSRTRAHPR